MDESNEEPIVIIYMEEELAQLRSELQELRREIEFLRATTTIPLEVDSAFRQRFLIEERPIIHTVPVATKAADSEDHGAAAAGLGSPDGFLSATIDKAIRYIPFYN